MKGEKWHRTCSLCGEEVSRDKAGSHIQEHHPWRERRDRCTDCGHILTEKESQGIRDRMPGNVLMCPECGETFENRELIIREEMRDKRVKKHVQDHGYLPDSIHDCDTSLKPENFKTREITSESGDDGDGHYLILTGQEINCPDCERNLEGEKIRFFDSDKIRCDSCFKAQRVVQGLSGE